MSKFTRYEMDGKQYEFPSDMPKEQVQDKLKQRWEEDHSSNEGMNPLPDFDDLNTSLSRDTIDRLIFIESSGNPNAKAPTSSATGLGQFINSTWLSTVKKHAPELMDGRTEEEVLALRTDPRVSIEMTTRHMEDNKNYLERHGITVTDGSLYMAHFAGVGRARQVYAASDDTPAEEVFSAAAVRANRSILQGKTIGEVKAWAERKMSRAQTGWVEKFYGDGGQFGETPPTGQQQAAQQPTEVAQTQQQPEPQAGEQPTFDFDIGEFEQGKRVMVRKNDTLSRLARLYGVSVEYLIELNGIEDPDNIPIGMVLRV